MNKCIFKEKMRDIVDTILWIFILTETFGIVTVF